jgi:hypothetical protein
VLCLVALLCIALALALLLVKLQQKSIPTPRLLCASANWGAGGWVQVQQHDDTNNNRISILAGDSNQTMKNATLWRIIRVDSSSIKNKK